MRCNDPAAALAALKIAARLAPRMAVHQFELGEHYRITGQPGEAIRQYLRALALEPRAAIIRVVLAGTMALTGEVNAALSELHHAIADAGDNFHVLIAAARVYRDLKQPDAAIRMLRRALALRPGEWKIRALLQDLLASHVPPSLFRMMNDVAHYRPYEAAICRAVKSNSHVLQIGTGSGVLAMMAARAGASLVTICEQVEPLADAMAETVQRNGYGERIRVVAKRPTSLSIGTDLPVRADVLISEVTNDKLLDRYILPDTAYARRHLLKTEPAFVPRAAIPTIRLVGGPFLHEAASVGSVDGFDLSPFNRFAPVSMPLSMDSSLIEDFSQDIEIFCFDLRADSHNPRETTLSVGARRNGTIAGVLQWLRLEFDIDTTRDDGQVGQGGPSALRHVFHPFPAPCAVHAGDVVELWIEPDLVGYGFARILPV